MRESFTERGQIGWEMEPENESRIKNGRELKEAMQTRAKKKEKRARKMGRGH